MSMSSLNDVHIHQILDFSLRGSHFSILSLIGLCRHARGPFLHTVFMMNRRHTGPWVWIVGLLALEANANATKKRLGMTGCFEARSSRQEGKLDKRLFQVRWIDSNWCSLVNRHQISAGHGIWRSLRTVSYMTLQDATCKAVDGSVCALQPSQGNETLWQIEVAA